MEGSIMKDKKVRLTSVVCVAIICITVLLHSIFIWPTFVAYEKIQIRDQEVLMKINRITGKVVTLVDGVWQSNEHKVKARIEQHEQIIERYKKTIETCEGIMNDPANYQLNKKLYERSSIMDGYVGTGALTSSTLNTYSGVGTKNKLLLAIPSSVRPVLQHAKTQEKNLKEALMAVIEACQEKIEASKDEIRIIKKLN